MHMCLHMFIKVRNVQENTHYMHLIVNIEYTLLNTQLKHQQ